MVSINNSDFNENFDIHEMCVGIVGFGYVGQAVDSFFSNLCGAFAYDKFNKTLASDTLEDVVRESHVIFVCVPTPMNQDGSCHVDIVKDVLTDIKNTAESVGRDTDEFVVVLKSTVYPGFTEEAKKEFPLRIVFSPEFLTEKNSIEDFENSSRIILGGDEEDCVVVYKFFEKKLGNKIPIVMCSPTEAETAKLFVNAFLMTKVLFGNEMYKLCQALNIGYDDVKLMACLDPRINRSHFDVPGHDGDFGAGGHCFIKDVSNLRFTCNSLKTGEKVFSAILDRNDNLRTKRDWEEMIGRAVVKK